MFAGHDPFLVALSVAVAILGGYTGFGLATRLRVSPGANRRLLLAISAAFLALGIWTMHFIGMLAAPMPQDVVYLALPTVVSFLICALVVGISLFFASIGEPSHPRTVVAALLLGIGIASMHYVGIHGIAGNFAIEHDYRMVLLSVLVAVFAAYGGLRIYLARPDGLRLAFGAVAFGFAVSGMHYTAMYGMHFRPMDAEGMNHATMMNGLSVSSQSLALIVALLCFLITGGFLLFLVPEARHRPGSVRVGELGAGIEDEMNAAQVRAAPRMQPKPLAGLGQPQAPPATRVPVEGANGTLFVDVDDIRSVRADAHYTLVHDGSRERMCSWPISEMEAQLCPTKFMRVHRSHIVAIPHIALMRREGDGAVVELDGPVPHLVPISRARIADLRARLGIARRDGTLKTRETGQDS